MQLKTHIKSMLIEKKETESNNLYIKYSLVINMKKQDQHEKSKKSEELLDEYDDKFSERHQQSTKFPDKVEMKQGSIKISMPSLQLNKLYANDNIDEEIKVIPSVLKSPKFKTSKEMKKEKEKYETFELMDVLKNVGLTPDELDKLGKNKAYSRIVEVIEMLNRIILDKNLQSRILIEENEYLNEKNTQLNNDNMFLGKQFDVLKKENAMLNNKISKNDDNNNNTMLNNDNSLINNTSNITINNVNINAINSINKVFPKKKLR